MSIKIEIDLKNFNDADNYEGTMQSLDFNNLTYSYFFKNIMTKNQPCLLKNVANSWNCVKKWVNDNKINCDYFIEQYGSLEAPVADCNTINFNSQCKINMRVKDFMDYLKTNNKNKLLYLKDWHLRRVRPDDHFYKVPFIFASDWLNEYSIDNEEDDFMFVYIGPKDSWTPFHCDVYSSFSWSVNVIGKKKWILLPPGEEEKLKDTLRNLPVLFEPEKFPNVKYLEILQEAGDAIFVPSGWHHQVFNLAATISVNHNFINACNIELIWESLQINLLSVEHEIEEFKESPQYVDQCQLILKSVFGMDFKTFSNFILHISDKRLKQLHGYKCLIFKTFSFGKHHINHDLQVLCKIIELIESHPQFQLLPKNMRETLLNVKDQINKSIQ